MSGRGDYHGVLSVAELNAWRGSLRTHSALIHELGAELVAAHELPLRSCDVLVQLEGAAEHRLRMTELSRAVPLSSSGVSRLVDRLEANGLVFRQRCEVDGRGYWVQSTDKGLVRLREARATHLAGVHRRSLARLDESELEALGRLWERLLSGGGAPRGACREGRRLVTRRPSVVTRSAQARPRSTLMHMSVSTAALMST